MAPQSRERMLYKSSRTGVIHPDTQTTSQSMKHKRLEPAGDCVSCEEGRAATQLWATAFRPGTARGFHCLKEAGNTDIYA